MHFQILTHEISVLLKITRITLNIIFLIAFSKSILDSFKIIFFTTFDDGKFKA